METLYLLLSRHNYSKCYHSEPGELVLMLYMYAHSQHLIKRCMGGPQHSISGIWGGGRGSVLGRSVDGEGGNNRCHGEGVNGRRVLGGVIAS